MSTLGSFGNNMILVAADDKKDKKAKGDGIDAVLTLMKSLRAFQEEVETCIDAQGMTENKDKIQAFDKPLDEMYEVLIEIASGGIRNIRKNRGEEVVEIPEKEEVVEDVIESDEVKAPVPPVMSSSILKMPK